MNLFNTMLSIGLIALAKNTAAIASHLEANKNTAISQTETDSAFSGILERVSATRFQDLNAKNSDHSFRDAV